MSLKDKVKRVFIEKLPNTLLIEHLELELLKVPPNEIQECIDELLKEGFLDIRKYTHNPYNRIAYTVKANFQNYPISLHTDFGSFKIPRMIDGDVARGEDINAIALGLSKVFDQKISDMQKAFDKEIKRYWASVAAIFGIFISIFSMISFSVKPIYFSELSLIPKEYFLQNLYNLGPFAMIMVLFVFLLWLVLRR